MNETWTKETCPHCGAKNWLCHGDVTDLTGVDIEACQCWSCEQKFFLGDLSDVKDIHFSEVQEWCNEDDAEYKTADDFLQNGAVCERGRKTPDDPYRLCR